MAHIAHARAEEAQSQKIRRAIWIRRSLVTAGAAVMLVIAIYVFFTRRHNEPTVAPRTPAPSGNPRTPQVPATAMYVPVLIDLSNASPVRGLDHGGSRPSSQVIPSSSLIDLTLQLPLGSEAREYVVRLSSDRHVAWLGSAQAHMENAQMLLRMHADFTHVLVGNYDLVVVSKGFRLSVPVVVKNTSTGRTQ
jgi:hypothetical protein